MECLDITKLIRPVSLAIVDVKRSILARHHVNNKIYARI